MSTVWIVARQLIFTDGASVIVPSAFLDSEEAAARRAQELAAADQALIAAGAVSSPDGQRLSTKDFLAGLGIAQIGIRRAQLPVDGLLAAPPPSKLILAH